MAKRRICILHAGMPKTGSSALQSFLARGARRLRRLGILYPRTGRMRTIHAHHHALRQIAGLRTALGDDSIIGKLDAELASQSHDVLILSSESARMAALFDPGNRLQPFFSQRGYDLHVVLYLRDQREFLNSSYMQMVRHFSLADKLDGYIDALTSQDHSASRILNTGELLRRVRTADRKVHFRPFNAAVRHSGIESDFVSLLQKICAEESVADGIADRSADSLARGKRLNESCGPVQLAVSRSIAEALRPRLERWEIARLPLVPFHADQLRRAIRRAGFDGQSYWGIDAESYQRLGVRFLEQNEHFARQVWGRGWAEIFSPLPAARLVSNDLEDTQDAAGVELAGKLLGKFGPRIEAAILRQANEPGRAG